MSKRYRETIEVEAADSAGVRAAPLAFAWRGARYQVLRVLGHWREDAVVGRGSPQSMDIPQRELWRVHARTNKPQPGVYDIVQEAGAWRMDRVWD